MSVAGTNFGVSRAHDRASRMEWGGKDYSRDENAFAEFLVLNFSWNYKNMVELSTPSHDCVLVMSYFCVVGISLVLKVKRIHNGT